MNSDDIIIDVSDDPKPYSEPTVKAWSWWRNRRTGELSHVEAVSQDGERVLLKFKQDDPGMVIPVDELMQVADQL